MSGEAESLRGWNWVKFSTEYGVYERVDDISGRNKWKLREELKQANRWIDVRNSLASAALMYPWPCGLWGWMRLMSLTERRFLYNSSMVVGS